MTEIQRNFDVYTDLGAAEPSPYSYPTILAIGPEGQLAIRHLTPGRLEEIGDVPIRTLSGYPVLDPRYAKAGWVMYEDLCFGRVAGIEGDELAWKRWRSLCDLHAAGQPIPEGKLGDDFWHPEVQRRQKDGRVPRLTAAQLRELFPGATIPDDDGAPTKPAKAAKKGEG